MERLTLESEYGKTVDLAHLKRTDDWTEGKGHTRNPIELAL
jgi:hypothetical protein